MGQPQSLSVLTAKRPVGQNPSGVVWSSAVILILILRLLNGIKIRITIKFKIGSRRRRRESLPRPASRGCFGERHRETDRRPGPDPRRAFPSPAGRRDSSRCRRRFDGSIGPGETPQPHGGPGAFRGSRAGSTGRSRAWVGDVGFPRAALKALIIGV